MDDPIGDATAVCLLPGTEIAFEKEPTLRWGFIETAVKSNVARFRQINKDTPNTHHDALEFADGQIILLTHIETDQCATVLQLPAAPKTKKEAEEQTRVEFVG